MILGLDLSSTSTGVCFDGETSTIAPKGTLIERARAMRDEIRHLLIPAPDLVVIEEMFGGLHFKATRALATIHALVLDEMDGYCPYLYVDNKVLKKFAVNNGGANKDVVLAAAVRAGCPASTNDAADAWWCYMLGEALYGRWHVTPTQYRQDVIGALNWPEVAA